MRLGLGWVFLLVWVPLFSCSDDDSGSGGGGPGTKPCEREMECEDNDPCTNDFCIDHFCQNNVVMNGPQPNAMQTDGDCKVVACHDGMPGVEPDDADEPDDDNGDCLEPLCVEGEVTQTERMPGDECQNGNSNGVCDGLGSCSCAPPSAGSRQFVDPVNGTDSLTNGGSYGDCAYATVDFALAHATGEIVIAPGTYSAPALTLPIHLTANQVLVCATDMNDNPAVTISGSGTFGTGTATVVYEGDSNGIENCIIDGNGADDCVAVTTVGTGRLSHFIYRATVRDCAANGIHVTDTGNQFNMGESIIDASTTAGLLISGIGKAGYLQNNDFLANGTDIVCVDPSPAFGGDSNGGPSCSVCENCPF